MKIERKSITVEHRIAFSRPALGLLSQTGQLLEALMDEVGAKYPIASSNISVRSTAKLDDWLLRLTLFNGLGEVRITVDGLSASFSRLATDSDLAIVSEVEVGILAALSARMPALKYSSEKVIGALVYSVLGGPEARTKYFLQLAFPGMSDQHTHRSFRAGLKHKSKDTLGIFEVAPLWIDDSSLHFNFDIELNALEESAFSEKVKIATELIADALASFQLEVTEG